MNFIATEITFFWKKTRIKKKVTVLTLDVYYFCYTLVFPLPEVQMSQNNCVFFCFFFFQNREVYLYQQKSTKRDLHQSETYKRARSG